MGTKMNGQQFHCSVVLERLDEGVVQHYLSAAGSPSKAGTFQRQNVPNEAYNPLEQRAEMETKKTPKHRPLSAMKRELKSLFKEKAKQNVVKAKMDVSEAAVQDKALSEDNTSLGTEQKSKKTPKVLSCQYAPEEGALYREFERDSAEMDDSCDQLLQEKNVPFAPRTLLSRSAKVKMDFSEEALQAKALSQAHKSLGTEQESDSEEKDSKVEDSESDDGYVPEESAPKAKKPKNRPNKLSEYEQMVQRNKKERLAFLKSLKMNEVKDNFADAVKALKPKRKKHLPKKPLVIEPRMHIKRMAKVEQNFSEEAIEAKALSEAYKLLEPKETVPSVCHKKIKRVLSFKDALEEGALYRDFERDFANVEYSCDQLLHDMQPHFPAMTHLWESPHEYFPTGLQNFCFHPSRQKVIIAASVLGQIGLWTYKPDMYFFEAHTAKITGLQFNPWQLNVIVSSSKDGTLKCGDLEGKAFRKVFDSKGVACTSFDIVSAQSFLVGQQSGQVSMVDSRTHRVGQTHQCHRREVRMVGTHPVQRDHFVSADCLGTLRLWDVRHLKAGPLDEVPSKTLDGGTCVGFTASFSPLTGKHLLYARNGTVRIYNSADLGGKLHCNQILNREEYPSYFCPTWLPNRDDAFAVGRRSSQKGIHVFRTPPVEKVFAFEYPFVVTNVAFHPSLPVVGGITNRKKFFLFSEKQMEM